MKNITAMYMILCEIILVSNVCFGMNAGWYGVDKIEKLSKRVLYSAAEQNCYTLNIFHKKEGDKATCTAELQGSKEQDKIVLSGGIDKIDGALSRKLQHYHKAPTLIFKLIFKASADKDGVSTKVFVKDVKRFYGPEKYHERKSEVVTGANSITFNLGRTNEGLEQIRLYQPSNVNTIRAELTQSSKFIVKFKQQGKGDQLVSVEKWTNGSYFWWNGWESTWHGKCVVSFYPKETVKPKVIEIDLDEDKKSEPQYRFNRNITYASILAMGVGILFLLRDNIRNFFSAIFYESSKIHRVFSRDYHNCYSDYGDEER